VYSAITASPAKLGPDPVLKRSPDKLGVQCRHNGHIIKPFRYVLRSYTAGRRHNRCIALFPQRLLQPGDKLRLALPIQRHFINLDRPTLPSPGNAEGRGQHRNLFHTARITHGHAPLASHEKDPVVDGKHIQQFLNRLTFCDNHYDTL